MSAWKEGRLRRDIVEEQKKVEEADLIIFQVRGHGHGCVSLTATGVFKRVVDQ